MDLKKLQELLNNKAFNPYINVSDSKKVFIHLIEEVGELARAFRNGQRLEMRRELGDVQILLLFFAESIGLELNKETLYKIRENILNGKFRPKEDFEKILNEEGL